MRLKRSKLTHHQTNELLKMFVSGTTARTAAKILGLNRNTAITFFKRIRTAIAVHQERQWPFDGGVEVDESYFGGQRKGKCGRGAAGKIPVFGILKRGGKVYAQVIENAKAKTIVPIIKQRILPDSIVYSDTFRSYNSLNVEGYHHVRINHSKAFATSKKNHINGIENFWNQAKRHLRKFNGIPKDSFNLYLKECEWRFNSRDTQKLLKSLRKIMKSY
ncbi:MAG TPA: IS1595 family transposase [Candidatus Peribacteraceae bacterium]|nr:IS1595 family transposase [Candidatus Nanoarchaeia archaeon]HLD71932.1 IS1595 family transposase [Candidatus Peribacteraceae bacterium]